VAEQHPQVKGDLRRSSLQLALKRTITLAALTAKAEVMAGRMGRDLASDELHVTRGANDGAGPASPGKPGEAPRQKSHLAGVPSVSELLEKKLHAAVGGPWREVEYNDAGRPVGTRVVPGKGVNIAEEEEEALLDELLRAPKDSRDTILTRMVYESHKKVEAMYLVLKPYMRATEPDSLIPQRDGAMDGATKDANGEENQKLTGGAMAPFTNLFQDPMTA
jgi:hypothetical protein